MQALRVGRLSPRAIAAIGLASALALGGLVWLLYLAVPARPVPAWAVALPGWNAACNGLSAALSAAGWWAIRRGDRALHRACMLLALAASAAFLTGYVVYHHYHGDSAFGGQGFWRPVYFSLLISHILASTLVLPLLLAVLVLALSGRFEQHRRLARWVWPLWLYVGVTGVLVYFFLRPYY
jgi:putative membrane protein